MNRGLPNPDRAHSPRPVPYRLTPVGMIYSCEVCPRAVRAWGSSRYRHLTWSPEEWRRWVANRQQQMALE